MELPGVQPGALLDFRASGRHARYIALNSLCQLADQLRERGDAAAALTTVQRTLGAWLGLLVDESDALAQLLRGGARPGQVMELPLSGPIPHWSAGAVDQSSLAHTCRCHESWFRFLKRTVDTENKYTGVQMFAIGPLAGLEGAEQYETHHRVRT